MAKYDRREAWNKTKIKQAGNSFAAGYSLVVNAWNYKQYLDYDLSVNSPFNKGIRAGIVRCKEREMENLLTGKRPDPWEHIFSDWKSFTSPHDDMVDASAIMAEYLDDIKEIL